MPSMVCVTASGKTRGSGKASGKKEAAGSRHQAPSTKQEGPSTLHHALHLGRRENTGKHGCWTPPKKAQKMKSRGRSGKTKKQDELLVVGCRTRQPGKEQKSGLGWKPVCQTSAWHRQGGSPPTRAGGVRPAADGPRPACMRAGPVSRMSRITGAPARTRHGASATRLP